MRAKCYNSEDNCDYAHYNTGWLAGGSRGQPPVQIDPNKEPDTAELPRSFPVQQRNSLPLDTSNLEGKDLTCYFWMRHPGGCIKPETQCSYSHRNTGWLLRLKGEPGPSVVRLGHMDPPRSMKSRSDVQVSLRDAPSRGDDSDSRSIREPGRKTCFFWHQGSCKKGQNCLYAHYDTGTVADPPPGYNQRHLCRCTLSPYLHHTNMNIRLKRRDFIPRLE
jgi:chromo domain-containing protein 1